MGTNKSGTTGEENCMHKTYLKSLAKIATKGQKRVKKTDDMHTLNLGIYIIQKTAYL